VSIFEKQECKSTKNPQFGKDILFRNGIKSELLPFCQVFLLAQRLTKGGALRIKLQRKKDNKQITNKK